MRGLHPKLEQLHSARPSWQRLGRLTAKLGVAETQHAYLATTVATALAENIGDADINTTSVEIKI